MNEHKDILMMKSGLVSFGYESVVVILSEMKKIIVGLNGSFFVWKEIIYELKYIQFSFLALNLTKY